MSFIRKTGLTREKRFDEAISAIKKSYEHAVEYDKTIERAKIAPIPYTCQAFNMLKCNIHEISVIGTETSMDNFREFIRRSAFKELQGYPGFEKLLEL